jgi:5-methylcytosine-specific restriction endonuclease McrA
MMDGEEVKITTRLRTYLKGTDCVGCGAKGAYFRKTRQSDQFRPHLNLYAINDGHEVLMTSDHIVQKSKGGPTVLENLQPMCDACNCRKADSMPEDRGQR